eukprot:TRINITY_DN3971_c0_g1_i1.p3 TRINITY_DN3971_c0_g1~~TRINITY_DN3971_c0_g1_i1.p3  ORF type:complete len:279 (+),score=47.57 TRINITY_DN3971_c0_g1_i1:79-915(+)
MLDADEKVLAQQRLKQLGEQFLSMFEEGEERKDYEEKPQKRKRKKQNAGSQPDTFQQPIIQEKQAKSNKKQKHLHQIDQNSSETSQKKPQDEIDALMETSSKVKQKKDGDKKFTAQSTSTLNKNGRKILKRINRGKAQALFEDETSISRSGTKSNCKDNNAEANFKKIRYEVGLLGAKELEFSDKLNFQGTVMKSLGGKPVKGKRISKKLGLQMFKEAQTKQKEWEKEALETGMITKQKLSKIKRKQLNKKRDFGLKEDGGTYRPGILRIRKEINKSK